MKFMGKHQGAPWSLVPDSSYVSLPSLTTAPSPGTHSATGSALSPGWGSTCEIAREQGLTPLTRTLMLTLLNKALVPHL